MVDRRFLKLKKKKKFVTLQKQKFNKIGNFLRIADEHLIIMEKNESAVGDR